MLLIIYITINTKSKKNISVFSSDYSIVNNKLGDKTWSSDAKEDELLEMFYQWKTDVGYV